MGGLLDGCWLLIKSAYYLRLFMHKLAFPLAPDSEIAVIDRPIFLCLLQMMISDYDLLNSLKSMSSQLDLLPEQIIYSKF